MPRNNKNSRKSAKNSRERALNAFDTAVDDEYYIKGLRHQQDIDLELISDERIKELLSNQVNSEDDEDIDSDEAMGSASDISLGEPDNDDEDKWGDSLDEAELMPLSEIWDLDEQNDRKVPQSKEGENHGKFTSESEFESRQTSESDSEQESKSDSDSGSELADDESDLSIENDLSYCDSDDEDYEALRRAIKSVSGNKDLGLNNNKLVEADEENPFALPQSKSGDSLILNDMVQTSSKAKPLSVPAPKRVQERADRSVAYDIAKQEVGKWADTVFANRQAEHLQFPINPADDIESASPFVTAETDKNDLEAKVANILQTSQLADEKDISTFEELAAASLSIEDVKNRRDRLRYMRELMFREEQRAKRIKKIKSKKYRKIHKKERERMAEIENGEFSDDDNREAIEKAERARALERATLRHHTNSKWAKDLQQHGLTRHSGTRAEIEEMLRQSEALRQKVYGSNDSSSDGDIENNLEDEQRQIEQDQQLATSKKGLLGMKFMQDAEEKERTANRRILKDDLDSDSEEENIGRKSYAPANQQLKRDLAAMEESDALEDHESYQSAKTTRRSNRPGREEEVIEFRENAPQKFEQQKTAVETTESGENPWIKASLSAKTPGTIKLKKEAHNSSANPKSSSLKSSSNKTIVIENTFGDTLVRAKDMTLKQQDLVKQAFADDDVVAEFNASKQEEIDEDKDQEIDETLPGWGTWSNETPRVQKIRRVLGINEKQRKDYKKANVIISEKVNKKAAKYNASAVPFPFENKQQYERSLRMPIGQEWVTKDTFQRQTKPRILVKRGTVIDPIKNPRSH